MRYNTCIFYSGNSNEECMNSAYNRLTCPYGTKRSTDCPCYLQKQHSYSVAPADNLSTKSMEKMNYVTQEESY